MIFFFNAQLLDQDMPADGDVLTRVSPVSVNEKTKESESLVTKVDDTNGAAATSPAEDHECSVQKDEPSCGKIHTLRNS